MFLNALPSEQAALVGVIDPDVHAAGASVSDYADLSKFKLFAALIFAGELGASGTLDAKLVQATDASGTGKKDVTGYAITQLTQAGTDADKQAWLNIAADSSAIDHENGFRYLAVEMTTAVASSDTCAALLGFVPNDGPASDYDLASVDEIVSP